MNEQLKQVAKDAMVHMVAEHRLEDFAYRIVDAVVKNMKQYSLHERSWLACYETFDMKPPKDLYDSNKEL